MYEELTLRQQAILRVVVQEHVRTATPVGSKAVYQRSKLGVRPATIRNEMATLEEKGYLTHPHTSAGRVPTEAGYRYFVHKLMDETGLLPRERRMIRHQFHQARLEPDQWLRLSVAVLAHSAEGVALVTAPRAERPQLRHVELVSIREEMALLILMLRDGTTRQQMLSLETPLGQEELGVIAHRLSDMLQSKDAGGIAALMPVLSGVEAQAAAMIGQMMRRVDSKDSVEIYRDGLLNILSQPEFANTEGLQRVLRMLEEHRFIERLVAEVIKNEGVKIIIGGEGKWDDLAEISLVLTRYGVDRRAAGALGVVGPLRMRYGRAVSVVRYISSLMSDLIRDLYGYYQD